MRVGRGWMVVVIEVVVVVSRRKAAVKVRYDTDCVTVPLRFHA